MIDRDFKYGPLERAFLLFFKLMTGHRIRVTLTCVFITVFFGYGLRYLESEADVTNMLPQGYPSVVHLDRIEEEFEYNESVVVAVVNEEPGGIYNPHTLGLIKQISDRMEDIRGVRNDQIRSIFTVTDIVGDEGGFAVVPLSETMPENAEEIAQLRLRIEQNTMFHGTLVAKSSVGAIVYAAVSPVADHAQIYLDVREMLDGLDVDQEQFYVTGNPVVSGVIGRHVEADMAKMMPLVAIVIVLMLILIFRNVLGVLLPLVVVICSVVVAMGMQAYLGIPIYPMSTTVPIVIMAIGVADGIHIITRYYEAARDHPGVTGRQLSIHVMMEMWRPVVMTSFTTAIGFMSLLSSTMKPVMYTGIFTAVGVLAAMFFSLTLIPASLAMMHPPKTRQEQSRWWARADSWFSKAGAVIYRFRPMVIFFGVLLVAFSVSGGSVVRVDSDPMGNFNEDDPIPISTKLINRLFSGTMNMNTTLESETEKRFLDPAVLRAVGKYQEQVLQIPHVGSSDSVVDFLMMMNQAMYENDPEYRTVPGTKNLVGNYLMLYSGENINQYINYDRDFINIQTRVATTSTSKLEKVFLKMEQIATDTFGEFDDIEVQTGGMGRVIVDMINIIVYGQITSIFLSIFGVFCVTTIMFRSFTAGFLSIVPITLATAGNFGFMGFFGIPLEPATAVTSCIGIGVGIDYAIHFIAKYQLMRRRGIVDKELVCCTMATAGKAIFFNAAVVIAGFMVLLSSQFPASRHLGLMVSLNMFISFAAAVTILPALLLRLNPAFCKPKNGIKAPLEKDEPTLNGGI